MKSYSNIAVERTKPNSQHGISSLMKIALNLQKTQGPSQTDTEFINYPYSPTCSRSHGFQIRNFRANASAFVKDFDHFSESHGQFLAMFLENCDHSKYALSIRGQWPLAILRTVANRIMCDSSLTDGFSIPL
jgi:hypothetical protein